MSEIEIGVRPDPGPLPRVMGAYTFLAPMGAGSSAEAFFALTGAPGLERPCVVKRVRADLARDDEYVARFLREGQILAGTSHGALAQVLEVGHAEDGVPFVAMEHVDGRDLAATTAEASAAGHRMPPEIAMHVGVSTLDGLHHAWTRRDSEGAPSRLLHGDLSLRSVVLSWDGQPKIVDHGMGRSILVRRRRPFRGNPAYLSPERARGEEVDDRSDVFSAGVLLWELLAGEPLVRGDVTVHLDELRRGRLLLPPLAGRVPRVPTALDRIISRATANDPEERYASANAFRNELAAVLHALAPGTGATHLAAFVDKAIPGGREADREARAPLVEAGSALASEKAAPESAPDGPLAPVGPDHVPGTRYRILGTIGEGGMGTVYDAIHVDLERRVALKVLHPEATARRELVERLRQEARAVARLGHENIVAATDFGQTADGRVFFAMERLEGVSLAERLAREGAIDLGEALRIADQTLRGLAAAHGIGLVHRDVKPENVFLPTGGPAKLLDFGIAKAMGPVPGGPKLTREGIAIGTPEYMAPEQAAAADVDERTDVYAVGVMLYEMVTGSLPFRAEAVPKLLVKHMEEPPERPSLRAPARAIPADVERIVMRALEKDPGARYQTATEMASEVLAALRGLSTPLEVPASARAPSAPSGEEGVQYTRPDTPTAVAEAARRSSAEGDATATRRGRLGMAALVGIVVLAAAYLGLRAGGDASAPEGTALPTVDEAREEPAPDPLRAGTPSPGRADRTPAASAPAAEEAAAAPEAAVDDTPDDSFEGLLERSQAAIEAGRLREAEVLARRAGELRPGNPRWRLRAAEAALRRGDRSTARAEVREILRRDPDNARALRLLERISTP